MAELTELVQDCYKLDIERVESLENKVPEREIALAEAFTSRRTKDAKSLDFTNTGKRVWKFLKGTGLPAIVGAAVGYVGAKYFGTDVVQGARDGFADGLLIGGFTQFTLAGIVGFVKASKDKTIKKTISQFQKSKAPESIIDSLKQGRMYRKIFVESDDPLDHARVLTLARIKNYKGRPNAKYFGLSTPILGGLGYAVLGFFYNLLPFVTLNPANVIPTGAVTSVVERFGSAHQIKSHLEQENTFYSQLDSMSQPDRNLLVGALAKKWYGKGRVIDTVVEKGADGTTYARAK